METNDSTPLKLFVKDLKRAVKCDDSNAWELQLMHVVNNKHYCKTVKFNSVWIQGTIEQNTLNDILIVNDNTGRVKLSNCKQSIGPDDSSWMSPALKPYCSVVGQLIDIKGVPEISATILTPVGDDLSSKDVCESMWPLEVEELKRILVNAVRPKLSE